MLLAHDVITIKGDPETRRHVLWVAPDESAAALIDKAEPNAMPRLVSTAEIAALIASGAWTVMEGEMPTPRLDHEIPDSHRLRRDQAEAVVRSIVDGRIPAIFEKGPRAEQIGVAAKAFGLSRPTVTGYVRRYFLGGMSFDALIPAYANCGAPGKSRKVTETTRKRGRPPAPGHPMGCNITDEIRRWFNQAIDRSYSRDRTHSLVSAWEFCVRHYLTNEVFNPETRKIDHVPKTIFSDTGLPTRDQFIYWVRNDKDKVDLAKRRAGARAYEMANKSKLKTSTARTLGPGSRYQIDATVLDLYVRSRGDRNRLVGRPTLYVVIDVFSRMVVGIYVGLEHPSWVAAMMALANAVEDKVEFCKRFGVEITEDQWPARHICGVLHGDGGELKGSGIEAVLAKFRMTVENHAPYRADWKGIVETRFKLLQRAFAPYTDGYVDVDFRARGGRDYREEAVLDIDDVTRIVIDLLIYYNNFHELVNYPRHKGQVQDGVPSVPLDLWNWGIATRSGALRRPNIDRFKFALMPRAQAAVTSEGYLFQGRYYSDEKAEREHRFSEARNGRSKVDISYDKRDVDRIYVHDSSELGFVVGSLTERSVECSGLSGWEAHDLAREYARISASRRDKQILARVSATADIVKVNDKARAEFEASPSELSPRAQVKGARDARAAETAVDRREEITRSRPDVPMPARPETPTNVVPLRPEPAPSRVAAPSMAELRASLRARTGQS